MIYMEIIKVPDNKVKLFYKELWPLIPEDKWEKEDCINFNLKATELICKFYNIDFNIDEYKATKYGDYCVPFFLLQDLGIYGTITKSFINELSDYLKGKTVYDVCAGNGWYELFLLPYKDIKIYPFDIQECVETNVLFEGEYSRFIGAQVYDIIQEDGLVAVDSSSKDEIIFMSWPAYNDPFAYKVVKKMKSGQQLIYIGEDYEGCNGDNKFFDYLYDNFDLIKEFHTYATHNGLHDSAYVYEKK